MQKLILEMAKKLFLKEGFENVTIRNIADKIEYSPATVYLYFKDKEDILFALHTEGFQKLFQAQQRLLSIKSPIERLRKSGEVYIKFALENPEYYDLMFIMSATGKAIHKQEEWACGLQSYDMLRQNVEECMKRKLIPKGNVDAAAFAFWSLVHGMASLIIRDRCVMIPEQHLQQVVQGAFDFMMSGLVEK